jgi:hypothetical protein
MRNFVLAIWTVVLGLWISSPAAAGAIYDVNVDTSSINGTLGNLDFTFAGGLPTPPAGTLTISKFTSNGTLGVGQITGDASGSLATQVILNNTGFPPADYFTPFTYGTTLSFQFAFSGLAVTNPDGVSGSSTFAFSLLDGANPPNPVLIQDPLPPDDPGGFAFTVDLNNDGSIKIQNFMTHGTVGLSTSGVPEPSTLGAAVLGLLVLAMGRGRSKRHSN